MPGREDNAAETTDFGFRKVPEADKPSLVRAVFDSVATRYDLMNDLMSGGLHRLWKAALIDWLMPRSGMTLLDLAGGTGDIAFRFLNATGGQGHATVLDASPAMIAVGRNRGVDRGLIEGIDWISGDAEHLPFPDRSFDACTIAFGLRNVTHKDRALAEVRRVLRPGGRLLCLEFSHVVLPLLDRLYRDYSFSVVPWLGAQVAGDREAYEYLVESIRRFPDQETLAGMIGAAGLGRVQVRNLSGGIAALHSAWRI